jgi:hypothetical protein
MMSECEAVAAALSSPTDARLDRWLVDLALRTGNQKTARMIAEEKNIEVRLDPW